MFHMWFPNIKFFQASKIYKNMYNAILFFNLILYRPVFLYVRCLSSQKGWLFVGNGKNSTTKFYQFRCFVWCFLSGKQRLRTQHSCIVFIRRLRVSFDLFMHCLKLNFGAIDWATRFQLNCQWSRQSFTGMPQRAPGRQTNKMACSACMKKRRGLCVAKKLKITQISRSNRDLVDYENKACVDTFFSHK